MQDEEQKARFNSSESKADSKSATKTVLPKPEVHHKILESEHEQKEDTNYLTVTTEKNKNTSKDAVGFSSGVLDKEEAYPSPKHGSNSSIKLPNAAESKTTGARLESESEAIDDISADLTETTRNIKRKFMQRRQTEALEPVIENADQQKKSKTGRNAKIDLAMSKLLGRGRVRERPQSVKLSKDVSQISTLRPILTKDPKHRTSQEIKQTQKCFLSNSYFTKIREEQDEKTYHDLCQKLRLEEHAATSVVFHFGDQGKYFYIILEGAVQIRVPKTVELEEDSATPEGLISFIVMYFQDIYWREMEKGPNVLQLFYSALTRFNVDIDESGSFNEDQALKAFDREISLGNTVVHNQIFKLLNPTNAPTITLQWFKTVNTLSEGEFFGDLALAKGSGGYRQATVICSRDTSLARLSRHDYLAIIGKTENRKKKKIVDEIKNYRIFANLRANQIAKIFLYMERREYQRGVNIYKEGETAFDEGEKNTKQGDKTNPGFGVYFIVKGEFQVSKTVKPQDDPEAQGTEMDSTDGKKITPAKNTKMKQLLRSKSDAMIKQMALWSGGNRQTHNGGFGVPGGKDALGNNGQPKKPMPQRPRQISLYLLGKNEIFGMEEIVDFSQTRNLTVTCNSTEGVCYYLKRESFQDCVNQFRFSDQVMEELLRKHKLFKQRVLQTHVFQQNYMKQQQESWNKMQAWAKKSGQTSQQLNKNQSQGNLDRNEIDLDANHHKRNNSDSKLELSSFLDAGVMMQDEYEMLHPRKSDTKNIQIFKKKMLETVIKPMSLKDHRDKINQYENLLQERQKQIELQISGGGGQIVEANDAAAEKNGTDTLRHRALSHVSVKDAATGVMSQPPSMATTLSLADNNLLVKKSLHTQQNSIAKMMNVGSSLQQTTHQGDNKMATIVSSRFRQSSSLHTLPDYHQHHLGVGNKVAIGTPGKTSGRGELSDHPNMGSSAQNMVNKARQTAVDAILSQIQAQHTRRTIQRHSQRLMQDNILHQMITPKTHHMRKFNQFNRQQSITKITRNMEKLDDLQKEDAEFHNFLSGARSTSHYSKREGAERLNSTYSKHGSAAALEHSARQQRKSLRQHQNMVTAKSLIRLQTLQSSEQTQQQQIQIKQPDSAKSSKNNQMEKGTASTAAKDHAQPIDILVNTPAENQTNDNLQSAAEQSDQKLFAGATHQAQKYQQMMVNNGKLSSIMTTEIEAITEEISEAIIAMAKQGESADENLTRNDNEIDAQNDERSSTFIENLDRVGSMIGDRISERKQLESHKSAVLTRHLLHQVSEKNTLSTLTAGTPEEQLPPVRQSQQCQILLSAVQQHDSNQLSEDIMKMEQSAEGIGLTSPSLQSQSEMKDIKDDFKKILQEVEDRELLLNQQLDTEGSQRRGQKLVPRGDQDAADHLSKSEKKLTKGASNTLSRVRFINKINQKKEVFSINPKSSGASYLNVKQPSGGTFNNRSDSLQEDLSVKLVQAQADSSRITFHSPFAKVDSTLPRISKQDEQNSSRHLHQQSQQLQQTGNQQAPSQQTRLNNGQVSSTFPTIIPNEKVGQKASGFAGSKKSSQSSSIKVTLLGGGELPQQSSSALIDKDTSTLFVVNSVPTQSDHQQQQLEQQLPASRSKHVLLQKKSNISSNLSLPPHATKLSSIFSKEEPVPSNVSNNLQASSKNHPHQHQLSQNATLESLKSLKDQPPSARQSVNAKQSTKMQSEKKKLSKQSKHQVKIMASQRAPKDAFAAANTVGTKIPVKQSNFVHNIEASHQLKSNRAVLTRAKDSFEDIQLHGKKSAQTNGGKLSSLATAVPGTNSQATIATNDAYALQLPEYLNRPIVVQRQRMMGQIKKLKRSESPALPLNSKETPYLQKKQAQLNQAIKKVRNSAADALPAAALHRNASHCQMHTTNMIMPMQISTKQLMPSQTNQMTQFQSQEFLQIPASSSALEENYSMATTRRQQQPPSTLRKTQEQRANNVSRSSFKQQPRFPPGHLHHLHHQHHGSHSQQKQQPLKTRNPQ